MPKSPVKSVTVHLRVYPKDHAAWKLSARAAERSLSLWICDRLNATREDRALSAEVDRLRMALIDVRGFLRGVARRPELGRGAKDLLNEVEALDRVLDDAKELR